MTKSHTRNLAATSRCPVLLLVFSYLYEMEYFLLYLLLFFNNTCDKVTYVKLGRYIALPSLITEYFSNYMYYYFARKFSLSIYFDNFYFWSLNLTLTFLPLSPSTIVWHISNFDPPASTCHFFLIICNALSLYTVMCKKLNLLYSRVWRNQIQKTRPLHRRPSSHI